MPAPTRFRSARALPVARTLVLLSLSLALAAAAHAARQRPARASEPVAGSRAPAASDLDALWTGYPLPSMDTAPVALVPFGGDLVVASGGFYFGTTPSYRVAGWDGAGWHAMSAGLSSSINALAVRSGQLLAGGYVASSVSEQPAVFAWDGASWAAVGNANGTVYALLADGTDLWVGGSFTTVNGVAAPGVARWDGVTWHGAGAGLPGATVRALARHGADLVAGGTMAAYQGVARWDGASWATVGAGLQNGAASGVVHALASDGSTLYASGTFNKSGATTLASFAAWNGSAWSALGSGTMPSYALALYSGAPVATASDAGARRPHFWSGSAWTPANHPNVDPLAYALDGATLYAGGNRSTGLGANPTDLGRFYAYDGAGWSPVQQAWAPGMRGIDGLAYCAQEWHGSLYVGGPMGYFGADDHFVYSPGAGRWDGASWNAVGAGGQHFDMAVWSDSLVACIDGWVKVWNGSTWRRLAPTQGGGYTFDWTTALAVADGDLYVLGPLYQSSPYLDLYGVGRWTGSGWAQLGSGIDDPSGYPLAGCGWGTDLVVGGVFASAGGQSVRNLASWDGAMWHDVGGGTNLAVAAVTEFAGDLVAGGSFTEAGGVTVAGAARFDGAAWHAMGTNAVTIERFRPHGGRLYAAGTFLDDLAQPVTGAALWTGADWMLLGSGVDERGRVENLEFLGDDLYLVGSFGSVSGQPARSFAKLADVSTLDVPEGTPRTAKLALAPSPNPSRGAVRLTVTLPAAGRVRLAIHDVSGREITRLLDGEHAAGAFSLAWDARVAPGLYFATLQSAGGRATTRLVRLR